MELTREQITERVLDSYSRWYDIEPAAEEKRPMIATAQFHEHGAGYVLLKSAKTWTADRHEYVYFYSVPHLTTELYQKMLDEAVALGEPLVNPVKGHMCTYIVMVVFCDTADEEALMLLKKCSIRKSFQFSLKGWMEVQTAAVEVGKASVTANLAATNTANFLKSVISPQRRRKNIFSSLFGRK